MNKKEYAQYLGNLIDDHEIDVENDDLSDQFYAYFQCFMPNGKDIEKIFSPLNKGDLLLERIRPIYKITEAQTLKQLDAGVIPGYFCPTPSQNKENLLDYAQEYIDDLKIFAQFIKDQTLTTLLNQVKSIIVVNQKQQLETEDTLNLHLYETISMWGLDNSDESGLIEILSEAYYSISCDYSLSYYLQYPVLKNKPTIDFLKAYYKIWKLGYHSKFSSKELLLYS